MNATEKSRLSYTTNHEHLLRRSVEHGYVAIDNNHVESPIRQFVIGRGNWMFCGKTDGAHAGATLYSLIITAKKNSLEPFSYLRDILTRIPCGEALEPILPWNGKLFEASSSLKTLYTIQNSEAPCVCREACSEKTIEIYHEGIRVAVDMRSKGKGLFVTRRSHYPEACRAPSEATPSHIKSQAARIGLKDL